MSDTPRTTAATLTVAILEGEPIKMVPVVVSEDMERELTAARDEIAEWQILNGWGETPEIINNFIEEQQTRIHLLAQNLEEELDRVTEQRDGLRSGIDYASDQLHKVTEQRDRLAEAVNAATTLIAAKGRHNTMLAYNGLRDALQSLTTNEL